MVDLLVLVLLVGIAVFGWRRGLAISLVAAAAFVLAGLPVAAVCAAIGPVPPVLGFLLGGIAGLVPVALRFEQISATVADHVDGTRFAVVDRAAGAALALVVATCATWFVAALVAIVPSDSGTLSALRSSATFGALVEAVPPQGGLGVLVLRSGLVPGVNGPLVLAEEPDHASAAAPAVGAASSRVLQVRGVACNQLVTGTGWVAGPGIVVTNAHVVAGTRRQFLAGGPQLRGIEATVTAFDPRNDIAVLAVDPDVASRLPTPLPVVARVRHGERAAVVGFPLGGRRLVVPARIDRVADYEVEPLGGGTPSTVRVLAMRASVQPGNSGGPVVAEDGSVLGLVVSKALGQRVDAAYGVPAQDLLPVIAAGSRRVPVATGPCLDESELRTDAAR